MSLAYADNVKARKEKLRTFGSPRDSWDINVLVHKFPTKK